jgi:hypothetical protein
MKEVKIKIRLPKELTVHIPTLSEVDLDSVLEIIAIDGKKLINQTITDRVLTAFLEKHDKLIGKVVGRLMEEKEEEIKKILEIN